MAKASEVPIPGTRSIQGGKVGLEDIIATPGVGRDAEAGLAREGGFPGLVVDHFEPAHVQRKGPGAAHPVAEEGDLA